jgi:hypothetical protein
MAIEQGPIDIRVHDDGRVEVLSAPPVALLGLQLLVAADPAQLRATGGRTVVVADQVDYEITGWDETQACLVARRIGGS